MKGKGAGVIPRWKNMLVDIQSKGSMKLFPHAMPCHAIKYQILWHIRTKEL